MIKVNEVLFDLATVYEKMSQAKIWDMANILTKIKEDLEELLFDINENKLFDKQYKEQTEAIEKQLYYVTSNIKTLQDALLCHESKIIEKRTNIGDLGVYCLN